MHVIKWLVAVAVLGVGISIVVKYGVGHHDPSEVKRSAPTATATGAHSEIKPAPSLVSMSQHIKHSQRTSGTAKPASEVSYRERFANAHDYFEFSHSILAAAQAGNADAEYYLWNASFTCAQAPVAKFNTMDEAESYGASLRMSMETVHQLYERCHKMRTQDVSDLGNSWDWLNRAVKAGQPVAQATTASFQIMQDRMKVAGIGSNWLAQAPIERDSDPQTLLREALQSGDPDALLQISTMTGLLNPGESHQQSAIDRWAWTVVACQRGASCSQCGSDCDTRHLMEAAGNDWGTVQVRAQEISDKLDSQQWDELGLGASVSDTSGGSAR